MADNQREITTVFKADISQFSASTQDLNRYIGAVNSEFKNATASMGRWSDNADGLQAKLTQLNGVLEAENKKLSSMEAAYADLVKQGKQNTKEAQNLATAINNQQAKVKETKKNIDYYSKSLKELKDAGVDSKKALEKVNKESEELKKNAKELGGNLLKGAATGLAAIGTAAVGALKGLSNLATSTQEYSTGLDQLETAYAKSGFTAEQTYKAYNDFGSLLGDTKKAQETMLLLGKISKTEEDLTKWTDALTGVYAEYGNALPTESLTEAINHTSQLGEVQGTLADALEWAGVNVDDFNEQLANCSTEQERTKLIQDTLLGLYGESAEQYKELNKDIIDYNTAVTDQENAMAKLGDMVRPAMTQFKNAMTSVLTTVMEKFQEVDIEGLVKKISDAITTTVNVALPPLMTALSWILDNLNWLAPTLATVIGLIGSITAGIKIYNAVVKVARTVQLLWNVALTANPIGLVIAAIGLLVAAFVVLWNKCEGFRNFWKSLWGVIKTTASAAASFISGIFSGIMNTVKGVINTIISAINGAIKAINKISVDIPDWVPEFGGKKFGFNIPTIPKLAQGGIIDRPTLAMVGEAGKEAVMPLENNTGWIDQLAEKLSGKVGASSVTNNFSYKFEKMETTKLALHKANLETKRMLGGK